MSAEARSVILGRIRDANRGVPHAGAAGAVTRDYTTRGDLDRDALVRLFVERLEHYQVRVHRTPQAGVPQLIATVLRERGAASVLVPADLDAAWLPHGFDVVPDSALSHAALDASAGVVTACSLAIAATGTLVLTHRAGEGRRALTLVPDYHLCIVCEPQIVQTVPEAMRLMALSRPRLITTISGPSATADIEMTRIRGVHGPRTLEVVIAA